MVARTRYRKVPQAAPLSAEGAPAVGAGDGVRSADAPPFEDYHGEVEEPAAPAAPLAAPQSPPSMRYRLRGRLPEWRRVTSNALVLDWVEDGFPLKWSAGAPPPPHMGANHQSAFDHADFTDTAVAKLVASNSAKPVSRKPHMVCPLGVVVQGEKRRLIWDGRPVNDHLVTPSFRYEDLKAAPGFLLPNDWAFTLDLSSGYHHLDIRKDCWTYLGFEWRGQYYVFTQLPFGLAPACWAFTKLTREVLRPWRRQGWRCSGYIDDQFHADQDRDRLVQRRVAVLDQLERLGFLVNREKSMPEPAQQFRYLGMLLDTARGIFRVPDDKRARVLAAVRSALVSRRVKARALASVKGQLLALSWAFGPWSRLRTRGLGHLIETRRAWSSRLQLSEDARDDLQFWLDYFDHFNGTRPLWTPTNVYSVIFCDAAGASPLSVGGWGAWTVLDGALRVARGGWDARTAAQGSTPQELRAVLNALRSFANPAGLSGHTVKVLTDNLNAANIINKGSAKADSCYTVAMELFWFCVGRGIQLQAEWRPRTENDLADLLSKLDEPDDWALQSNVFSWLSSLWGPFTVDLFASAANHQLPTYYSLHFTPDTAGVDAFRFRWGRGGYANPPFGLLLRVLKHARACDAHFCLIAPLWPTKDWWPFLTGDGKRFEPFVHGVRILGNACDVLRHSRGRMPARASSWSVMALLIDFSRPSPQRIKVPADPHAPAPRR